MTGVPRSIAPDIAKYWFGIRHNNFAPTAASASASLNPGTFRKRFRTRRTRSRLPVSPKILLNAGSAPKRSHVAAGDQQDGFRQAGDQPGGCIETRRSIDHHVTVMRHQHVEEANKLGGGRIDGSGHVGSRQQLQPAAVARHEAFEQGSVHAVKIAGGVGHVEYRLQIHVQRGVAERSKVHQRSLPVGGLQRQREIDGHGSRAVSAFCIDDRKNFAANPFLTSSALRGGEAHERLQHIGGIGRPFDEFARPRTHGVDDDLRLVQVADGKNRGIGHFLMQQFDGSQGERRIVGGNVDQGHIGIRGAYPPGHRIRGGHRKAGAGMDRPRHTGAVDQHLQHRALLVVGGDNYD